MRFYLYTDSAIWRIPHSLLRKVGTVDWDDWYDLATDRLPLGTDRTGRSVEFNSRTEQWPQSRLPKGLYALPGDPQLSSESNQVKVMHLYVADEGEMLYWKETYLG